MDSQSPLSTSEKTVKWRVLSESDWYDELVAIERTEKRDLAEAKSKKRKAAEEASTSSGNNNSAGKANKSTKQANHGNGKSNNSNQSRGVKLCVLCQSAGLPEKVFRSHHPSGCKNKEKYAQALAGVAGANPGARGNGNRPPPRMEHRTTEYAAGVAEGVNDASLRESLRRCFRQASHPNDVVNFIRMIDPVVEDSYLARRTTMYYDAEGNPELQSAYPMAYDYTNAEDGDQQSNASTSRGGHRDGHY